MPSKDHLKKPEELRRDPDGTPLVNQQNQPTGGLLEPTTPRHLPDPFTDPGPLLDPVPTVDLTEGTKEKEELSEGPGLVDPRVLQPGPADESPAKTIE